MIMASKKTLVIGASENPARYSYLAVNKLKNYGHPVEAIGKRKGSVNGIEIVTGTPPLKDIDTVTLYVNPQRQSEYFDYVADLKPRRVIFNPGTENPAFEDFLTEKGIEPIEACTLVMLSTGQY